MPHTQRGGKWLAWTVATIHLPSGSVQAFENVTPLLVGMRAQPRCLWQIDEKTAL